MLLVETMASEIRQETVSEYKKEDEIDKLKEEVNCLLKKIKKLGNIEVERDVFGLIDHTRIEVYSNGDIFSRKKYFDKQCGSYRTEMKMTKTTIDEIPERHKITVLNMQKELMEDVLNNFSNENSRKK